VSRVSVDASTLGVSPVFVAETDDGDRVKGEGVCVISDGMLGSGSHDGGCRLHASRLTNGIGTDSGARRAAARSLPAVDKHGCGGTTRESMTRDSDATSASGGAGCDPVAAAEGM
jgi:hypothetical protein